MHGLHRPLPCSPLRNGSRNWQIMLLNDASPYRCLQGVDNSEEYAKQLLQPPLDSPPPLDDLKRFIQEPPAAQIPITVDALDAIRLPPGLRSRFTAASGLLARAVGMSLTSPLTLGDSEMWTAIAEHAVVVSLLLALDKVLPSGLRIGYEGSGGARALHG